MILFLSSCKASMSAASAGEGVRWGTGGVERVVVFVCGVDADVDPEESVSDAVLEENNRTDDFTQCGDVVIGIFCSAANVVVSMVERGSTKGARKESDARVVERRETGEKSLVVLPNERMYCVTAFIFIPRTAAAAWIKEDIFGKFHSLVL